MWKQNRGSQQNCESKKLLQLLNNCKYVLCTRLLKKNVLKLTYNTQINVYYLVIPPSVFRYWPFNWMHCRFIKKSHHVQWVHDLWTTERYIILFTTRYNMTPSPLGICDRQQRKMFLIWSRGSLVMDSCISQSAYSGRATHRPRSSQPNRLTATWDNPVLDVGRCSIDSSRSLPQLLSCSVSVSTSHCLSTTPLPHSRQRLSPGCFFCLGHGTSAEGGER